MLTVEAMPIKDRLKQLRTAAGLTQQALAVRAGLSVSAVVQIESGKTPDPRVLTLQAIAKALSVTLDDFVVGDEPEAPAADQGETEQPKKPRKRKGE
jgi:transcriptional regulator with XRE-family HTH domain